ncbi:MAG TPA: hypothetical protein VER96_40075 [Polyangiaceae bacterium]|nr:hypothetical protein [Polyangiaceae bacterium]
MSRKLIGLALCGIACLLPGRSNAQTAALLAVSDASQVSELQLAKVMADDSSLWLSVRLQGRTRLALVTAETAVEPAPAAHAWLRALDFATRVRVAAPVGPLASCGTQQRFEPHDTGLPEAKSLAAVEVSSVGTDLELRRRLSDAGLPADAERVARFTSAASPPFRVSIYDVPADGGSTETVRLTERGYPTTLPRISLSGADTVPLSVMALAKDGVQPLSRESADPSDFPVVYRAVDASSDYLSARHDWLGQNPTRWLNEVQASAPLFGGTVLPSGQRIEPVISRYFAESRVASASACETRARAAYEHASNNAADFACDAADDLARSLTELDFAEPRASRFFGRLAVDAAGFRVVDSGSRSPLLFATDFDPSGCPGETLPPVSTPSAPSTPSTPAPVSREPVVVSSPEYPYYGPTTTTTTVYTEDSCTWSSSSSSSHDSCSGDSSTSESSSESCNGDSSSSESNTDTCSGDSSSSESSSDSCGGDSSDSKYDGDTCTGDSAESNSARSKSAALGADPAQSVRAKHRPRPVRLSLVTLLAAALGLPLRRRYASR